MMTPASICMPGSVMARKAFLLLPLLGMLFLMSCNLRQNALLPPGLDPMEYIVENTIRVYSDHLIKSENDDSYIYIPRESIADDGLWFNDTVTLRKVEHLLQRDSLAFATGSTAVTKSYALTINRYGTEILLDSIPNFATLYTDIQGNTSTSQARYVQSGWRLSADSVAVYPYGNSRCFFDVDGNGDLALLDLHHGTSLQIEPAGKDVQALLDTGSDYVYVWFPEASLEGPVQLSLQPSLSTADAAYVQRLFPGFALNTSILELQGQLSSTASAIVRYRLAPAKYFGQQWIRLNGEQITGWENSPDTWLYEENELITFLQGPGKYFLATPLSAQNSLELPLDGSYGQIYLQDLWLDLRDTTLSGGSLKLILEPDTQALIQDYFTGTPYTLSADHSAFRIEFRQNGSLLEILPNSAWIEFGFRSQQAAPGTSRLFQVFRSASADKILYKTHAAAYDESHFSLQDSFVYAGYSSSGTYLFGTATENSTLSKIPCLKAQTVIQTQRSVISWNDAALPCSAISLEYGASLPTGHPWLSGEPYNLSGPSSIMRLSASYRGRSVDSLPAGLFLSTLSATAFQSVVNFSPQADYPKFVLYKAAAVYEHNSFVFSGSRLNISPAFAGYLFDGALLQPASTEPLLAMYNKMVFDNYAWEVYQSSEQPLAPGTLLKVVPKAALTDSYAVFATQYDLTEIAPVYAFTILNNPAFYSSYQPLIRIRQGSRTDNLLFSVSSGEFYRIYSYEQRDELDGWHFTLEDGHAAFYLAYDAEFAAVHDNTPHTETVVPIITAARDFHLSLYQAQFVLPSGFLGNQVPLGTFCGLKEVAAPQGVNALSAYQLILRDAVPQSLTPDFYDVLTAPRLPYIYVPIPDFVPGQSVRLFYRNLQGETLEFTQVDQFGPAPTTQFILVGNCAVCFVDNPGTFYTTP